MEEKKVLNAKEIEAQTLIVLPERPQMDALSTIAQLIGAIIVIVGTGGGGGGGGGI